VAVKRFPFSDEWVARFRFARGSFESLRARRMVGADVKRVGQLLRTNLRSREGFARTRVKANDADDQPADRNPREAQKSRKKVPALQQSPQKRGVCTRVYDDSEEAELGASQGRQGASDQRLRGHRLHSG
jgi:hypothetical protein